MDTTYTIDESRFSTDPSLIGVIAPGIRLEKILGKNPNRPENIEGFFADLDNFIRGFNYPGFYHSPSHFLDVENRFFWIMDMIEETSGFEFSAQDRLLAKIFSKGHDCVHNATKSKEQKFYLSVESICELYGLEPTEDTLRHLLNALNVGIEEDNDLSGAYREPITSTSEPITQLSDEEMSAIVVDAFAYKNGFDISLRIKTHGLIQASEVSRSLNPACTGPGFKWPRTHLELIAKLADLGNFTQDIDSWLKASTNAFVEQDRFKGTTAIEYVDAEIEFLELIVENMLKPENLPRYEWDDNVIAVYIPKYFSEKLTEKLDYLHKIELEILRFNPENGFSADLRNFLSHIRPALEKNDLALSNPTSEVTLSR